MKNTKKCPKCASSDIVRIESGVSDASSNFISAGFFSLVSVNRYLCCRCGYSEEWIDKDDLEELKNKYKQ